MAAVDGSTNESIQELDIIFNNPDSYTVKHPLKRRWTFWFDNPAAYGKKSTLHWRENLKKIYTVQDVEGFWGIYNYLTPASDIPDRANYYLFREKIEPSWEDPANSVGGKWTILLPPDDKPGESAEWWMKILLVIVGEQCDEYNSEILGAMFSRRREGNRVSVWTATADNSAACRAIGKKLHETVGFSTKNYSYQRHAVAKAHSGASYRVESLYTIEL